MNQDKHKYYIAQLLTRFFRDAELRTLLGFKGGTALMYFHGLPRFSIDLDFNLLDPAKEQAVFKKVRATLRRFGTIDDEAVKHYGSLLVLNYGRGERMLKVEISNRQFPDKYETLSLAGTDIRVMTLPCMFAHKLCAMGERLSPRDVFDCWFFLQRQTPVNEAIIRQRTGLSAAEYARHCATLVREASPRLLMQGLGEVIDAKTKTFVRTRLIEDTATALELFAAFPQIDRQ